MTANFIHRINYVLTTPVNHFVRVLARIRISIGFYLLLETLVIDIASVD